MFLLSLNLLRNLREKVNTNAYIHQILSDVRYRITASALLSFIINLAFAVYNCFLAIYTASAWFITMVFYYMILGLMRFYSVLYAHRLRNISYVSHIKKECSLMRQVGIIIFLLTPALSGTVVLIIKQNHIIQYSLIMMITIATYTFYKITLAIINYIRVKKLNSPLLATIRNINIADAAMSILPMQSSMIVSFDQNSNMDLHTMTILTGTGICIVLLWLGTSMIVKSKR